jgi:hypothetical protein
MPVYYFLYLILFTGLFQNSISCTQHASTAELVAVDAKSQESFRAQALEDASLIAASKKAFTTKTVPPRTKPPRTAYKSNISTISPNAGLRIEALRSSRLTHETIKGIEQILPSTSYIEMSDGTHRELHNIPTITIEKTMHHLSDTTSTIRPRLDKQMKELYENYDLLSQYCCLVPNDIQETSMRLNGAQQVLDKIEKGKIWYTSSKQPKKTVLDLQTLESLINTQESFTLFEEFTRPKVTGANIIPVRVDANNQFWKGATPDKQEKFNIVTNPLLIKLPTLTEITSTITTTMTKQILPVPELQNVITKSGVASKFAELLIGIANFTLRFTQYKLDIPSAKAATSMILNIPSVKQNLQETIARLEEIAHTASEKQTEALKPIIKTVLIPAINWINPDTIQAFLLLDSLIGENINYHVNAPPEYIAINNPYRKYIMLTTQNTYRRLINNFCENKENCIVLASKHPNQTTEQYKLALEHAYIKHKATDDASIAIAQKTETPIEGARHYLKIKHNTTDLLVPFWWTVNKAPTNTNAILDQNSTLYATADLMHPPKTLHDATVMCCNPSTNKILYFKLDLASHEIYTLQPLVNIEDLLSSPNLATQTLVKTIPFFSSLYSSTVPLDKDEALSTAVKAGIYDIEEFFKNNANQNAFFAKTYPSFMQSLPPTIGEISTWITKYTTISFVSGDGIMQSLEKTIVLVLQSGLESMQNNVHELITKIPVPSAITSAVLGSITRLITDQINLIPSRIKKISTFKTLDFFSIKGIKERIIGELLDDQAIAHESLQKLPELANIPVVKEAIESFLKDNITRLRNEIPYPDFINALPESISEQELLNPSTQESRAKILSVISTFSQFLLAKTKDYGSGSFATLFRMFIPKEIADTTRWQFYTVAKSNTAACLVTTFEEIDAHALNGIKQLFLYKQGTAFKAMTLTEKREAIKTLDAQFARHFNAALEEWESNELAADDSSEGEAIAQYRATLYAKDLERSRTSQELIAYTKETYAIPQKKLASLIEAYTKYQRLLHTYQSLALTPAQSPTDITQLKEQIKTEAENIVELLTTLGMEHSFFIKPPTLDEYKKKIMQLEQSIAKHPIKLFSTQQQDFIKSAVSEPLELFESFRPYVTQCQLKIDAISKIATECLQTTFKKSDITITAPYTLSELEPITDKSTAKIKPTYHVNYKALASKTVRVSLAAKLCQYFIKDRNEFVVESLLDNAEIFAGLLAPNTTTTKAKIALINKQLRKLCCYAPLKISLHGGVKHTLLYLLFYELICYIEAQVPDQHIAKDLFNQLEEFIVKNTSGSITALKEGTNPFTTFEKDFLRKILHAANKIRYSDTKLPPIPITWLGHALLGSFNPIRTASSTLETITSKDFLDTPVLAKLLKKNKIIGGAALLNTSPEVLEELSKNSITKQILPFLKDTQLMPDFYEAPWFICLKKFFIGLLTIRNMEQILTKQLTNHIAKKESFFKNVFMQITENKKNAVPNKEIKKVLEKEIALSSGLPKSFSPIGALAGKLGFTQAQGLLQDGLILLNARSKASLIVHLLTLGIPLFRALSIPLQKFLPKKGG